MYSVGMITTEQIEREHEELTEIMTTMGYDKDDFNLTQTDSHIRITLGYVSPVVDTNRSHGTLSYLEERGFKVLFLAGAMEPGKMFIAVKKA